jgi:hypothetical protein
LADAGSDNSIDENRQATNETMRMERILNMRRARCNTNAVPVNDHMVADVC